MWAARLEAPCRFESIEVASPAAVRLTEGEVMLRTLTGGICGSDIPKFRGLKGGGVDGYGQFRPGPPGFPLHEIVGEIVAPRNGDLQVGQRVVGWAKNSQGLAEFVVTRRSEIIAYNPLLSPVEAVLIQPLACVLEALDRVAVRDRRVAVIGLGPIGLLFARIARARGAGHIVGVDPVDRSAQREFACMDHAVASSSADWAATLEPPDRPEVVIEAVGHQVVTLDDAITASEQGGTILCFGIPDQDVYPINLERIMRKNLTIIGGVTHDHQNALRQAEEYLVAHPDLAASLITHCFDRGEAMTAFETAAHAPLGRLKVVLSLGT